jgi:hypothetical protein
MDTTQETAKKFQKNDLHFAPSVMTATVSWLPGTGREVIVNRIAP